MARGKAGNGTPGKRAIAAYSHRDKQRPNNPPVGLVTPETDRDGARKTYAFDPHLDPQLQWAGKAERPAFEVPTVSLHVHERIDPRTILEAVRKRNGDGHGVAEQPLLFETREANPPLREAIEFYKHPNGWTNRMVAGDSLLVMNSLLEKEGMAGKVQMIYMDPPYGIKYGSNFQPFVNKRDVKDGKDDDLTQEPEMIQAFRDTWELGIHSYLSYLRDRLHLCRELLSESGSCFVQISDENVHLVRNLMDEVFGAKNFCGLIVVQKTGGLGSSGIKSVADYLVWYAKSISSLKYHKLLIEKLVGIGESTGARYDQLESPDGKTRRPLTADERAAPNLIPAEWKPFQLDNLTSGAFREHTTVSFKFEGETFHPGSNACWKTTIDGLNKLALLGRIQKAGKTIRYVRYLRDFPAYEVTNVWDDVAGAADKVYVVQTSGSVIQRCLLMTTDPGDLVLDPTCGSGTTAYVAEQWGRRWITCDTSRVAVTLAKQRLMTALYDYYELAHPEEGVGSGFKYKTVPHVTLKSIANNPDIEAIRRKWESRIEAARLDQRNEVVSDQRSVAIKIKKKRGMEPLTTTDNWSLATDYSSHEAPATETTLAKLHRDRQREIDQAIARHADQETLYDQPFPDKSKARVTGPFTVEAVPAPTVRPLTDEPREAPTADASIARSGESRRQDDWRSELLRCGIRGKGGQKIEFSRVEPLAGTRWLQADGETKDAERRRVVLSFGPVDAPLEQRQVAEALEEANRLVPKPKVVAFAAFHFDPEAAKDIDETNWPGVTLLKVQMNTDLLTEDLKKKRASSDSFWMVGQPDIAVTSGQWLVDSEGRGIAHVECIKKLSGLDRLEEINGIGEKDLRFYAALSQRRNLWLDLADAAGLRLDPLQYRGGTGTEHNRGIHTVLGCLERLDGGVGDLDSLVSRIELSGKGRFREFVERMRRDRKTAERLALLPSLTTAHWPLATRVFCQVEVYGFDYYNPKTGAIESGDTGRIALWLLDPDYDGRSLYPRQVFFPIAGEKEGWARLAKNLKAEIDEDLIEAYRGSLSLPFELGQHKRIAIKIVDDRGIESLKIVEIEP